MVILVTSFPAQKFQSPDKVHKDNDGCELYIYINRITYTWGMGGFRRCAVFSALLCFVFKLMIYDIVLLRGELLLVSCFEQNAGEVPYKCLKWVNINFQKTRLDRGIIYRRNRQCPLQLGRFGLISALNLIHTCISVVGSAWSQLRNAYETKDPCEPKILDGWSLLAYKQNVTFLFPCEDLCQQQLPN